MWRSGEEKQELRRARDKLAEAITFGLAGLVSIAVGSHLVGFIYNRQVPAHFSQRRQHILLLGEIHRGNDLWLLLPHTATPGGIEHTAVYHSKGLAKAILHLAQPLVSEMARDNDERASHQPAVLELLQKQASHDRLAGAGVVRQEKTDAVGGQNRVIDGINLMRQRVNLGDVYCKERIELVGEADAQRFQCQKDGLAMASKIAIGSR